MSTPLQRHTNLSLFPVLTVPLEDEKCIRRLERVHGTSPGYVTQLLDSVVGFRNSVLSYLYG
jgi:hypothetical protein